MNRLHSTDDHRPTAERPAVSRKIVLLLSCVALLLLMAVFPQTSVHAATVSDGHDAGLTDPYRARVGESGSFSPCIFCPPPAPAPAPKANFARPRVQAGGKDTNGGKLLPGDEVLWTITVKNVGSITLTDIIVTDMIPEWTSYVAGSIDGPGAGDGGYPTLTWVVDALEHGEKQTLTFRTRINDDVPAGTCITNQASADSAETPAGDSKVTSMEVYVSSGKTEPSSSAKTDPDETKGPKGNAGDKMGAPFDPVVAADLGRMVHQFALALKLGPDGLDLIGLITRLLE